MEALPPIPTPFPQRWREFRIQILPVIVFVITIGVIVFLWRNYVHPSDIVGEVETIEVNVMSIMEGTVSELIVDRFETVVKGQPICLIVPDTAVATEASLKAIAAEWKLMQARMDLDKYRNLNNYTQNRITLLTEQLLLGVAQARLEQAEQELQRVTELFSTGGPSAVATEFELQVAKRDSEALRSEITNRRGIVSQLELDQKELEKLGVDKVGGKHPAVEEAILVKQEELRLLSQPVVLKAPMDGVITDVSRRSGEKVIRGDSVVTIVTPNSQRIVGYLRQPLNRPPTTNDAVTVISRTHKRQVGMGQVLKVGIHLEEINPLLLSTDASKIELGLPFLVSIPEGMNLRPGEFVDLKIEYAPQ